MEIWTIQVAKYRLLQGTDIEFIDTTVKSGGNSPFKPTWDIVMGHKNGTVTDAEYTQTYRQILIQSYQSRRSEWDTFLVKGKVAVACYCQPGKFCHRHLLVKALESACRSHRIPFVYKGEILDASSIEKS